MSTHYICMLVGWLFLIASWVYPSSSNKNDSGKMSGRVIKVALSSLALGAFIGDLIYVIFS